jgi:aldehyde oxidoreductase
VNDSHPPSTHLSQFSLNGEVRDYKGPPFKRLANALRDDFALTGTKVGCDAGDCGACTVLIDGRQACACMVPMAQTDGCEITTVEGLGSAGEQNSLQRAFLHHGAAQCGICTPGMLMAATELLNSNPEPDRTSVEDALGGVLCRCTGYQTIIDAVMDAHTFTDATPPRHNGPSVGTRLERVDGIAKVSGTDQFGADSAPADALWLRLYRSPHARATFEVGDLGAFAAGSDGIETILSAREVPGENSFGVYPHLKDQPVFADGHVRYRGEAVLAIVGTREAVDGMNFGDLPIKWQPQDAVTGVDAALQSGAATVHDSTPGNVLTTGRLRKGKMDTAFESAAVADGTLQTAFVEHAYIEPEAGFAERVGNRIEVTACTQAPYMDLDECARVLGVKKDAVRIIPSACGGGFGGKLDASVQLPLAVAAWNLNRPVRCVYTRIESMASSTKRHPAKVSARAAADAKGRLTGFEMSADFDTGAYASWGPTVADRVPVHATGPYFVPNIAVDSRSIYTNGPPSGAFRGFGVPQAAMLQEQLYEDLALQLEIDPLEFRHINAIRPGVPTATGQKLEHSVGLAECLDALRPHWTRLRAEAEAQNTANGSVRRRGVGIGCMWYGCGNTSMSNPSTMRVALTDEGYLTLYSGAVDIGQGSNTIMLQICADALGLPTTDFSLVLGDTDLTADAGKTSASRQTFVSGKAAFLAGQNLRAELLRMANTGDAATLRLEGTTITVSDDERVTHIALSTLPTVDDNGTVLQGEGTFDPPTTPLDADGQGNPYATYGFAAQIADLEVDMELGTVHLRRIIAAHDLGKAINPTLVEGQIHGGIAQGIGLALMEEYIPGRTENLHDYLIPTFGDVPEMDVILVEEPEPQGPYGAKGIGEPALVPTAPAIFNAVRHATGIRVTRAPLLPHRLKAALDARAEEE